MFHYWTKFRTKSTRVAPRAKSNLRKRLFETLETRRVFAAIDVAEPSSLNLFFDTQGGGDDGIYSPGESVNFLGGADVFDPNARIRITFYEDTPRYVLNEETQQQEAVYGLFEESVDLDGNMLVDESGAALIAYDQPAVLGNNNDFNFDLPGPSIAGNYWAVITVYTVDPLAMPDPETGLYDASQFVNSAISRAPSLLEVIGGSDSASIDSITGLLVPGTLVTISGSTSAASYLGTWLVTYDSNNDGVYETLSATASSANQSSICFTPSAAGNYRVQFEADTSSATILVGQDFTINTVNLVDGVAIVGANATGGELTVEVPLGATSVVVYGQGGDDTITVVADSTVPVTVFGGAGNDVINVVAPAASALLSLATATTTSGNAYITIDGGDGNDIIFGGSGNEILLGGAGSDLIYAGAGRNIVIGGDGADVLIGGGGDDIIIAGQANLTDTELAAIAAIWSSNTNVNYRISTLLDTTALSPALQRVTDDDATDCLVGLGGYDWFFANLVRDGVTDPRDLIVDLSKIERARYQELQ